MPGINYSGHVVHTRASVTKQYNLVPAKGQRDYNCHPHIDIFDMRAFNVPVSEG